MVFSHGYPLSKDIMKDHDSITPAGGSKRTNGNVGGLGPAGKGAKQRRF
jgi:hypothetical protein